MHRALRLLPRLASTVRVAPATTRLSLQLQQLPVASTASALIFARFQSSAKPAAEQPARPTISKDEPPKVYDYEQLKQLVINPDSNKIIVDVREPFEYQAGCIPGAINIPYKSTPGALDLSPEEFEDAFKFTKPSKDKELIFYCLAGVRSTAAADLAQIFGYNKLGNYIGSYQDWVSHEQPAPEAEESEVTEPATTEKK